MKVFRLLVLLVTYVTVLAATVVAVDPPAAFIGNNGVLIGGGTRMVYSGGSIQKVGFNAATNKVVYKVICGGTVISGNPPVTDVLPMRVQVGGGLTYNDQGTFEIGVSTASFEVQLQCYYLSWTNVGVALGGNGSTATLNITNTVPRKTNYTVAKSGYDLRWRVIDKQTGKTVLDVVVPKGTTPTYALDNPQGHDFVVTATAEGYAAGADPNTLVSSPGTATIVRSLVLEAGAMGLAGAGQVAGVNTDGTRSNADGYDTMSPVTGAFALGTATAGAGSRFTVDPLSVASGVSTDRGSLAAANLVANAVGVVGGETVTALNEVKAAVHSGGTSGGGGPVTVDMAPTDALITTGNGKLDGINSTSQENGRKIDALAVKVDAAETVRSADAAAAKDAIAARDAAKAAVRQQEKDDAAAAAQQASEAKETARIAGQNSIYDLQSGVSGNAPTIDSGNASIFQLEVAGYHFDLDPAHQAEVSTAAAWFKALIKWGLTTCYAWWCWGQLEKLGLTMTQMEQAKGNTVAGTGGQVTAMVAAGIITVIIFTAIPAIWAAASTPGISTSAFWTEAGALAPSSSAISGALYLVYFFLPVGFILTLVAQAFVFRKLALGICIGVFSAIKYVVP